MHNSDKTDIARHELRALAWRILSKVDEYTPDGLIIIIRSDLDKIGGELAPVNVNRIME